MKNFIVAVALAASAFGAAAQEAATPFAPLSAPGYTWNSITFPSSIIDGREDSNLLLQGKVEQGIDWFKLGSSKSLTLNTFVDVGYSVDNNKIEWNNKVTPGIGIKLKHDLSPVSLEYGVRYGYERRWVEGTSGNGFTVFVNMYSNWNLRK